MSTDSFTHFDRSGAAHMVAITEKSVSARKAIARARVRMNPATLAQIQAGENGKGDVLGIARIAGITGAKMTSQLIPLCHPVALSAVNVQFEVCSDLHEVTIHATVDAVDRTGPDMEAMSAVSIAALTIYDMCKAIDREMSIVEICLLHKSGGKSGMWQRDLSAG